MEFAFFIRSHAMPEMMSHVMDVDYRPSLEKKTKMKPKLVKTKFDFRLWTNECGCKINFVRSNEQQQ